MAASGGLLTGRTVLLVEIESAYATDPTPTVSANEVEVFGLSIKPVMEKVERKPLRASLSPLASTKSKLFWEVTFDTELKNGGTAGTAGRLSPLFRSAGMTETVNAGTSVVYTPGNPSGSCTIYVHKDGVLFKATGCRGNFEITCEAGKIPMIKWTFRGIYNTPTDVALPSPTYEATIGQVAESVAMSLSGFAGHTRSYSINMNNVIVDRASLNSANATVGVVIGSRTPSGKLLMEAELLTTEPTWTEFDADTLVTLTAAHGATAGNIVTITGTTKAQYDSIEPTDENGIFMYDIGFALSGTDNELTLTLT